MGRCVFLAAVMLFWATGCVARSEAAPSSASALPGISAASSSPVVSASASSATSIPGQCSSPQASTRLVIERLFQLSTSGDARAVSDCYASPWRARDQNFADASARWVSAGPVMGLQIDLLDRAKGCDRFRVSADLANGGRVGWSGPRLLFYAVGPEGATPRIFEVSTALVSSDLATTTCQ